MKKRYWKRPDHGYVPPREDEEEVLQAGRDISPDALPTWDDLK